MAFFNKKEDVIDLKLTQYGKMLLSRGRFKPAYYQFFDDEILYDSKYAGYEESQNSIEDRIKENQYLRTQYMFKGAEAKLEQIANAALLRSTGQTTLAMARSFVRGAPTPQRVSAYEQMELVPDNEERENALRYTLYNSDIGRQDAPSLKVLSYGGHLTGSLTYFSGSNTTLPIPVLKGVTEFSVVKDRVMNPESLEADQLSTSPLDEGLIFADGTIYFLTGEGMLFSIEEENVPFSSTNYEIEVFEIVSSARTGRDKNGNVILPNEEDTEDILVPLYFDTPDQVSDIKNYFEILVDKEIPFNVRAIAEDDRRGLFVPISRIARSDVGVRDIYAIATEEVEECD